MRRIASSAMQPKPRSARSSSRVKETTLIWRMKSKTISIYIGQILRGAISI
jgi:hypothetical protein